MGGGLMELVAYGADMDYFDYKETIRKVFNVEIDRNNNARNSGIASFRNGIASLSNDSLSSSNNRLALSNNRSYYSNFPLYYATESEDEYSDNESDNEYSDSEYYEEDNVIHKNLIERYNFTQTTKKNENCTVCLDKLENYIIKTNCNHCFHKNCIEEFLKSGGNKCPNCRSKFNRC